MLNELHFPTIIIAEALFDHHIAVPLAFVQIRITENKRRIEDHSE